jgi:hypothetical protein
VPYLTWVLVRPDRHEFLSCHRYLENASGVYVEHESAVVVWPWRYPKRWTVDATQSRIRDHLPMELKNHQGSWMRVSGATRAKTIFTRRSASREVAEEEVEWVRTSSGLGFCTHRDHADRSRARVSACGHQPPPSSTETATTLEEQEYQHERRRGKPLRRPTPSRSPAPMPAAQRGGVVLIAA